MATPQAWALATSAMLAERNHERHDLLGGRTTTGENVTIVKKILSEWWGVENREDLLKVLQWLEYGGHRADFERLGAYLVSLDEQQLAELLAKVKQDAQARHQVEIVRKHYAKLGRKSLLGWD
jgi:hypothetical protein